VRVDVCEMGGIGEIAMEETGEENKLDGGREERGNYVETYLVSGLWMERERKRNRVCEQGSFLFLF
jgi:hypothetical protein